MWEQKTGLHHVFHPLHESSCFQTCAPLQWLCWISFLITYPQLPSYLFVFDEWYDIRCRAQSLPVTANECVLCEHDLNKGSKSWAVPSKACCSAAEVACLLIGYFQLRLTTIPYSLLCAKMFQSKLELSLLFPGPSRQVTGVYSQRGSLSWTIRDEVMLK